MQGNRNWTVRPTHRFLSDADKNINSLGDSVLLNDDPKVSGTFWEDFSCLDSYKEAGSWFKVLL